MCDKIEVKIIFPDGDIVDAEFFGVQKYYFGGFPMVDAAVRFAYTTIIENYISKGTRNLEQGLEDKAEYLGE